MLGIGPAAEREEGGWATPTRSVVGPPPGAMQALTIPGRVERSGTVRERLSVRSGVGWRVQDADEDPGSVGGSGASCTSGVAPSGGPLPCVAHGVPNRLVSIEALWGTLWFLRLLRLADRCLRKQAKVAASLFWNGTQNPEVLLVASSSEHGDGAVACQGL